MLASPSKMHETYEELGMTKLHIWLKLLRIHTSCLTQAGVMLGAIIAGVRNPYLLALYALFALAYHGWGFLDNNLCDFQYDVKDPAKKHFPLVTGEIPFKTVRKVTDILLLITLGLGLALCYPLMEKPTAIAFLLLSVVSGVLYNRRCKVSLHSPLFITIAFTSLPLFAYFTVAQTLNPVIIALTFYSILLMEFQIAVEGYLKDLETDPVNLLRSWGSRVIEGKLQIGVTSIIFTYGLKGLGLIVGGILWYVAKSDLPSLLLMSLLSLGIGRVVGLLLNEKYDNKSITKNAAVMEILTYFYLVFALQGVLGWVYVGFFILYPIVWFMAFNRVTWGTMLRPRV